ncbi:MAG: hypothetical protein ACOCQN_00605 [Halanaerobiaceae bacterium]
MKKELLKIASKLENFHQEREKNQNDKYVSNELAKERISKAEKEFKNYAEDNFQKVENKLNRQAEKARKKLQDLQGGDYDRRQYEYTKAVNELSNYDDPIKYLQDKKEMAGNEIELQEARKAALSKARATDAGTYEQLKSEVVSTMSDDELEARRKLAKVELRKQDLEGAKNSLNYDFYDNVSKSYGDPELIKTNLIAYSETDNIDQKAEKKIADTI